MWNSIHINVIVYLIIVYILNVNIKKYFNFRKILRFYILIFIIYLYINKYILKRLYYLNIDI